MIEIVIIKFLFVLRRLELHYHNGKQSQFRFESVRIDHNDNYACAARR
jgi:hypothetical protein